MKISNELKEQIDNLQILERTLQSLSMEKQHVQIELNEINNALTELKGSSGETYKMLSGIMVKADREVLAKELNEKKKMLDMRISSIENREKMSDNKAESLRKEINAKISTKK